MNTVVLFCKRWNKCYPIPFVLLISLFFVTACDAKPINEMIISLSFPKSSITLNEPIYLDLSIHNKLARDVDIDLGMNNKTKFYFWITDPNGLRVQTPQFSDEGFGSVGRFKIKPNEAYKQRILFNEWYHFAMLGTYKIEPMVDDLFGYKSGGEIKQSTTQVLSLKVLPRDEDRIKQKCQELAERAITSRTYLERLDATLALSYVTDFVAVPYLRRVLAEASLVKHIAIQGLVRIPSLEAVDALASNLQVHYSDIDILIVKALNKMKTLTQDKEVIDAIVKVNLP